MSISLATRPPLAQPPSDARPLSKPAVGTTSPPKFDGVAFWFKDVRENLSEGASAAVAQNWEELSRTSYGVTNGIGHLRAEAIKTDRWNPAAEEKLTFATNMAHGGGNLGLLGLAYPGVDSPGRAQAVVQDFTTARDALAGAEQLLAPRNPGAAT